MAQLFTKEFLIKKYLEWGFIPVLLAGYNKEYNPNKDMKLTKVVKKDFLTLELPKPEIVINWIEQGGYVRWYLHHRLVQIIYFDESDFSSDMDSFFKKFEISKYENKKLINSYIFSFKKLFC